MPELDLPPGDVFGGVGELRGFGAHGSFDPLSLFGPRLAGTAKMAVGAGYFGPLFFSSPPWDVL